MAHIKIKERFKMPVKIFSREDFISQGGLQSRPWHHNYLAMYNSLIDGIVTDPALMVIPLDDHMVHRSDGVFEAFKCVNGNIYNLERHLERLDKSAEAIFLNLPVSRDTLRNLVVETTRAGGKREAVIRIFISRGPGGFSVDPTEPPAAQVYIVVTTLVTPDNTDFEQGIPAITVQVPLKPSFFANIKATNYLPNMLVKLAAKKAGVTFAIALDENNCLTEGATESVAVVDRQGRLITPELDKIIKGTTACRVMELADDLARQGKMPSPQFGSIPLAETYRAGEVMFLGTSIDILPVVNLDGKKIGTGQPGPVYRLLRETFLKDIYENKDFLTPVF
ncbi:MAG: aminotransferase class IV [Deltaproteobacteria bacterium]|nr:aminotransferase class IV [Deltaproteobacteria bacterium]